MFQPRVFAVDRPADGCLLVNIEYHVFLERQPTQRTYSCLQDKGLFLLASIAHDTKRACDAQHDDAPVAKHAYMSHHSIHTSSSPHGVGP